MTPTSNLTGLALEAEKLFEMGLQQSTQMSPQIKTLVETLIKQQRILVFSKTYCPYCTEAKNLLKKLGQTPYIMELDKENDGSAIQQYLMEKTGQRTVPSIFIKEEHVGGCSDLKQAHADGSLKRMLE